MSSPSADWSAASNWARTQGSGMGASAPSNGSLSFASKEANAPSSHRETDSTREQIKKAGISSDCCESASSVRAFDSPPSTGSCPELSAGKSAVSLAAQALAGGPLSVNASGARGHGHASVSTGDADATAILCGDVSISPLPQQVGQVDGESSVRVEAAAASLTRDDEPQAVLLRRCALACLFGRETSTAAGSTAVGQRGMTLTVREEAPMSAGGGLGSSERSRLGPEVADSCGRPKKSLSCFSCFAGSAMSGVTTPDVRPTASLYIPPSPSPHSSTSRLSTPAASSTAAPPAAPPAGTLCGPAPITSLLNTAARRALDASPAVQAHNGGSTTAVSGALAAFGPVQGLACGQYGEASADVHSLLKAAASVAASVDCRIGGAAGT
eukprot:scaffold35708_cov129-Isochrysis_galbana.AAC.5